MIETIDSAFGAKFLKFVELLIESPIVDELNVEKVAPVDDSRSAILLFELVFKIVPLLSCSE